AERQSKVACHRRADRYGNATPDRGLKTGRGGLHVVIAGWHAQDLVRSRVVGRRGSYRAGVAALGRHRHGLHHGARRVANSTDDGTCGELRVDLNREKERQAGETKKYATREAHHVISPRFRFPAETKRRQHIGSDSYSSQENRKSACGDVGPSTEALLFH